MPLATGEEAANDGEAVVPTSTTPSLDEDSGEASKMDVEEESADVPVDTGDVGSESVEEPVKVAVPTVESTEDAGPGSEEAVAKKPKAAKAVTKKRASKSRSRSRSKPK